MYLGELEEIKENSPPEIFHSVPAEGEIMHLTSNEVNKAYVLLLEPDGLDIYNFYWNIDGELLGTAERIFNGTTVGSKLTINDPEPSWDGDTLVVFIYNVENSTSTERRWTINLTEGN